MDPESNLDTLYSLNPRIVSSIRSPESMVVFGTGASLELPLDLFRVLMTFAEKTTTRQAFESLEVDIDIDEFAKIIRDFFDRGLLRHEQLVDDEHGLPQLLNPRIASDPALVDKIGSYLRQGRAIVIPDALPADLAERVYSDLDRATSWNLVEGGHDFFHYRNCVIEGLEDRTPALTECCRLFRSTATRRFIGELSGEDCAGKAGVAAAWYRPGEYALPHDDSAADAPRSVAYIWYLTKSWRQDWVQCLDDLQGRAIEHSFRLPGRARGDSETVNDQWLLAPRCGARDFVACDLARRRRFATSPHAAAWRRRSRGVPAHRAVIHGRSVAISFPARAIAACRISSRPSRTA
jgi:hypothetical protein